MYTKLWKPLLALLMILVVSAACGQSQNSKDRAVVENQQQQYAIAQPIPVYDFSVERDLVIRLYNLRNEKVATHSFWYALSGKIMGDCPSMGYGIPYDTSLTNPWAPYWGSSSGVAVGQPEPNGIFASTNTAATWVMCVGENGNLEPHYIEATVEVRPFPLEVDYETNMVYRAGDPSFDFGK